MKLEKSPLKGQSVLVIKFGKEILHVSIVPNNLTTGETIEHASNLLNLTPERILEYPYTLTTLTN